jgi:hypothetical protein
MKDIDPSASGGVVANSPPKPTIPPIRPRIRGPFTRYPAVNRPISALATRSTVLPRPLVRQKIVGPADRAVNERISKPPLNPISSIEAELAELRKAFRIYRSTNSRRAVYIFLSRVFAVVTRWQRLDCALKNARAALRLKTDAPQMKPEPFAIVILCTADPEVVDAKTRSKWSRVLRYAQTAKPGNQRLTDFVKSNGGLNECARRFARRWND